MARTIAIVRRPRSIARAGGGGPSVGAEVRRLAHATARTLRDSGVVAVIQNALAAGGARRLTIFQRSTNVLRGGVVPPEVTLGEVTDDGVAAYLALRPDAPPAEVRRRLAAGDVCMGAWREDRLLSVRWLARGRAELHYLGVSFALAPGVLYEYDAFTAVDERRAGLSAHVTDELIRIAAREGATSVLNAVLPENRGGMALARRDPAIGVLRTVRLGPRLLVATNLPPGYLDDPRAL